MLYKKKITKRRVININKKLFDNFENVESEIIINGEKVGEPNLVVSIQDTTDDLSVGKIVTGFREKKKIPFKIDLINEHGEDIYKMNIPAYDEFGFNGRGLVIAGSGTSYRYVTGIFINVYLIRKVHNSNIPIEIFYVGLEEEFPKLILNELKNLGNITIINLLECIEYIDSIDDLRGYQTKPLACMCSSFSEIILMDADAISFVNPTYLFNIKGYENGMVLFKDYVNCLKYVSKDFINKIGIGSDTFCKKTGGFEIDSSCIIINKEKAWEALYTICFINVKSEQYYRHKNQKIKYNLDGTIVKDNVLGDKDTWLIGSLFVGFEPFIDHSINPLRITINNNGYTFEIDGHFQRGSITIDKETSVVPLYYNNQHLRLDAINIESISKMSFDHNQLPENVIISFLSCKDALNIIHGLLDYKLLSQRPVYQDFYYLEMIP